MRITGTLATVEGIYYGSCEINPKTGLIEAVGPANASADLTFPREFIVFPGFVDLHVHAREDASGEQVYKEDFKTMSHAAIHGGVVHVADMPNNPIPPVTDESYEAKRKLAQKSHVDVTLYAGIGPRTEPLGFTAPYKVFMGKSVGDMFFSDRGELEAALARYKGQCVSFHCEDPEVLAQHRDAATHTERRPAEAEVLAVKTALELIAKYGLQGKICHVSTAASVAEIARAKRSNLPVTVEVTPHHLYFDSSMALQMNPPLRSPEDRRALIEHLRKGDIDFLASDHAPHTLEEREQGISGVPHLDTYGAFVTWLMRKEKFTPQDICRVAACEPGKFLEPFLSPGNGHGFGRIEPGYVGSLTVIDPNEPWRVERQDMRTKCGWSPFEEHTFPGRVRATVIRGVVHEVL